jgi:ABC-type multidrug transport system ATPase subunit
VRSPPAVRTTDPIVAAAIGVRRGHQWVVRSASFRVGAPMPGRLPLGIQVSNPAEAAALVDVLAGVIRPAYGELRVLGYDMTTARGRAAVRGRVGVARRASRTVAGTHVRTLVEHAARLAAPDGPDRHTLAAAILDRLSLSPWADVRIRLAPPGVARRAKLAAAAVFQPELLLLDGLLDGLMPRDARLLADAIADLAGDTGILVTGTDAAALDLVCDEVLVLADGVLVTG